MTRTRPIAFAAALLAATAARAGPPATVAYLGIAARPADAADAAAAGLPDGVGLTVTFVEPTGPAADRDAVRVGDLLHKLDDQLLVNAPQMVTLVRTHRPGDTVTLTVIRDGKPTVVTVKLAGRARPKATPPAAPIGPAVGEDDPVPSLPGVAGDPVTGHLVGGRPSFAPGTTVTYRDAVYTATVSTDAAGHRTMVVARADNGAAVAHGPVDTAEQWAAFPADVRQHLKAVEALLNGKATPPRP